MVPIQTQDRDTSSPWHCPTCYGAVEGLAALLAGWLPPSLPHGRGPVQHQAGQPGPAKSRVVEQAGLFPPPSHGGGGGVSTQIRGSSPPRRPFSSPGLQQCGHSPALPLKSTHKTPTQGALLPGTVTALLLQGRRVGRNTRPSPGMGCSRRRLWALPHPPDRTGHP